LLKQSALKFAHRSAQPAGCATMFLSERFELDIENKSNPLVAPLAGRFYGRISGPTVFEQENAANSPVGIASNPEPFTVPANEKQRDCLTEDTGIRSLRQSCH
jgi:hypothetical protein